MASEINFIKENKAQCKGVFDNAGKNQSNKNASLSDNLYTCYDYFLASNFPHESKLMALFPGNQENKMISDFDRLNNHHDTYNIITTNNGMLRNTHDHNDFPNTISSSTILIDSYGRQVHNNNFDNRYYNTADPYFQQSSGNYLHNQMDQLTIDNYMNSNNSFISSDNTNAKHSFNTNNSLSNKQNSGHFENQDSYKKTNNNDNNEVLNHQFLHVNNNSYADFNFQNQYSRKNAQSNPQYYKEYSNNNYNNINNINHIQQYDPNKNNNRNNSINNQHDNIYKNATPYINNISSQYNYQYSNKNSNTKDNSNNIIMNEYTHNNFANTNNHQFYNNINYKNNNNAEADFVSSKYNTTNNISNVSSINKNNFYNNNNVSDQQQSYFNNNLNNNSNKNVEIIYKSPNDNAFSGTNNNRVNNNNNNIHSNLTNINPTYSCKNNPNNINNNNNVIYSNFFNSHNDLNNQSHQSNINTMSMNSNINYMNGNYNNTNMNSNSTYYINNHAIPIKPDINNYNNFNTNHITYFNSTGTINNNSSNTIYPHILQNPNRNHLNSKNTNKLTSIGSIATYFSSQKHLSNNENLYAININNSEFGINNNINSNNKAKFRKTIKSIINNKKDFEKLSDSLHNTSLEDYLCEEKEDNEIYNIEEHINDSDNSDSRECLRILKVEDEFPRNRDKKNQIKKYNSKFQKSSYSTTTNQFPNKKTNKNSLVYNTNSSRKINNNTSNLNNNIIHNHHNVQNKLNITQSASIFKDPQMLFLLKNKNYQELLDQNNNSITNKLLSIINENITTSIIDETEFLQTILNNEQNNFLIFSKTKSGSRLIVSLLRLIITKNEANPIIVKTFEKILPIVNVVMSCKYSGVILETLLPYINSSITKLLEKSEFKGNFTTLCCGKYSNRIIQSLVNAVHMKDEEIVIKDLMKNCLSELSYNQYANFVLNSIITRFSYTNKEFVFDYIEKKLFDFSMKSEYGHYLVKNYIKYIGYYCNENHNKNKDRNSNTNSNEIINNTSNISNQDNDKADDMKLIRHSIKTPSIKFNNNKYDNEITCKDTNCNNSCVLNSKEIELLKIRKQKLISLISDNLRYIATHKNAHFIVIDLIDYWGYYTCRDLIQIYIENVETFTQIIYGYAIGKRIFIKFSSKKDILVDFSSCILAVYEDLDKAINFNLTKNILKASLACASKTQVKKFIEKLASFSEDTVSNETKSIILSLITKVRSKSMTLEQRVFDVFKVDARFGNEKESLFS